MLGVGLGRGARLWGVKAAAARPLPGGAGGGGSSRGGDPVGPAGGAGPASPGGARAGGGGWGLLPPRTRGARSPRLPGFPVTQPAAAPGLWDIGDTAGKAGGCEGKGTGSLGLLCWEGGKGLTSVSGVRPWSSLFCRCDSQSPGLALQTADKVLREEPRGSSTGRPFGGL